MKIQEINQKNEKELDLLLKEKRERLRSLRFDLVGGKVKNVREVRSIRKDIAKIMTLLNINIIKNHAKA